MKVKEAIRFIIDSINHLYSNGESESIAFIILEYLGYPRQDYYRQPGTILPSVKVEFINVAVGELKKSRPVQYILGETEFYGLKFYVNENVLIPRQETEELVQMIARDNKVPGLAILDLGTGSGCIAVSLARSIPSPLVYATDISEGALTIALTNAEFNGVHINFFRDDILNSGLDPKLRFNVIVSNPPYVLDREKELMHSNVLNFEPAEALFVRDNNPMEFYNAIAKLAAGRLIKRGSLYVEINENFAPEVCEIFKSNGLSDPEIIRDIHEKNRFVKAVKI